MLSDFPSINFQDRQGWPWNEEVLPSTYANIEWPKISIVTPSYNQGKFLEETIRSILLQNYPNLEYIIIDGGSTDESVDIIKKYEKKIQYWISEKDDGQSDALIKGFNKSTGEILNWINSDDILHPKALYHVAKAFMENQEISFVHGKNGIISKASQHIGFMPHPYDSLEIRYLYEMPYGQQSCFFKSVIYFKTGGINGKLRFSMDYDLYVRMHLLGVKSLQISNLIGSYREHVDTKTHNLESIMRHENGVVFTTFLASVAEKKYSLFFEKIGFQKMELYPVKQMPSKKGIRKAILMFLKKSIWYYYEQDVHIAYQMSKRLIVMQPSNFNNRHYIKIIKDYFKRKFQNEEIRLY